MTDESRGEPRLGPPAIEPLSDAAWSRVERAVWAQLDGERPADAPPPSSSRRWWLVAAPIAAAAAVAAVVLAVRGGPAVLPDEPYRVVSGPAPTSVSFGDSHIALDAETALVMRHEDSHPTVLLERGAAWFTVAPRRARPDFVVRAGDAMVRVVGTRFRVVRSEERIAVEVDRGLVDVSFRGAVVAVSEGQRWSSDAPSRILATAAPPQTRDPVVAPGPSTEATSEHVPEAPDVSPPAPVHTPAPLPTKHRPPHAAGSATGLPPAPSASTAGPALITGREADDRDRAEYDRLTALEVRSPETALTGYIALAKGDGRWAAPALYAAARLAADRRDRRAETLLGMYLTRFPDGANAVDARRLLDRLRTRGAGSASGSAVEP